MSGGKASTPQAPDYSAIASSTEKAAQLDYDLGQQQLDFYKDQYNTYLPYVKDYLQSTTATSDENRTRANEYYGYYKDTYKPIESSFARQVADYNTPVRTEVNRGRALTDVANQYSANRNAALSSLESYGIDPSQTRYGALDLSSRIAEAGAAAAAGTKSTLDTEKIGLGLEGEAIKTGRGYAPDISSAYTTATQAGSAGTSAGTNLYNASGSTMGTPTSYLNAGTSAYGASTAALDTGYKNSLASVNFDYNKSADTWKGIGGLTTTALGFLL